LAHARPHRRHGLLEGGTGQPGDGRGERLEHGAVVGHRGAGHVQAGHRDTGQRKVSSAIAGEQVMPRPPGPVTRTTPGSATHQVPPCHPGVRGAGTQDHQVALVPGAGVIAHRVRHDLGDLPPRKPLVTALPLTTGPFTTGCQVAAQRGQHLTRLDDRVGPAEQAAGELWLPADLDLPATSWPRYLAGGKAQALEAVLRLGFVLLRGVPAEPGRVLDVAASFALPYARDAVAVRRWDDEAKDPAITPPGFGHFEPLLAGLLRSRGSGTAR
jgi:hypothetical protein